MRAEFAALWPRFAEAAERRGEAPRREAAMALAARRLRLGLLVTAVARRHGLVADGATVEARALEDRVVGFLLSHAPPR